MEFRTEYKWNDDLDLDQASDLSQSISIVSVSQLSIASVSQASIVSVSQASIASVS
jgi:hypothetical protein